MRIGIILDPYGEDKPTGLGWYMFELTTALLSLDKENEYLIYTKRMPAKPLEFNGSNWKHITVGYGKLWREVGLRTSERSDIYIFGTAMLPITHKLSKTIVVAHDFPYQYVKADTLKQLLLVPILDKLHRFSLNRADAVVGNSKYSKDEVIKLFGTDANKVHVISNGFTNVCALSDPEKVNVPTPFFLSVGAVKERKNTMRTVKAFAEAVERGLPHHFVIVGKTGNKYSREVSKFIEENNLTERVHFLGYASHAQLAYLYKNAEAFLSTSSIESFGLVALEAASCGLPVIASKTGGVSETMADGGLLVDHTSIEDMADAMYQVATKEDVRELLIAKGHSRSENFSWEKTGHGFLTLIDSLK